MYTEEPRREIDWGNLIKKGLIILLVAIVIFLVIWLVTKNNSNSINVDYNENNSTNSNIENNKDIFEILPDSDSYSEVFIDNYRYFHDTAKEYFLISNLPAKGNTIKFTLQELINKNLILKFSYGNSSCDTEASYVTVKNIDGKYTMTTNLVCGKEIARTTEELGCNQLCDNGSCEIENVTKIEYQYKQPYQATETTYSCPSGYTKSGSGSNTKCVKTDSSTTTAIKTVTYNCPEGYTKSGSGSNTKCTKESDTTISATKKTTYSCPSGYTKSGSGSSTKCYKKSTSTSIAADYYYTYSCPDGYLKTGVGENTKCSKVGTKTVNATKITTYSCPSGYTKSGSGSNTTCTKGSASTVAATASTTYSCPSGYTKSGTTCTKSSSSSIAATASTTYSCSKGTLTSDNKCRESYTSTTYESYYTYKGKSYNGCSYSGSYTEACNTYSGCTRTAYKYACTSGSYKEVDATATTTYSCPSGYTKSGTTCTKGSTSTVAPTKNTAYTCEKGTLDGTKCIQSDNEIFDGIKTKTYYCLGDDYELSGSRCYTTGKSYVDPTKKTTYSCPEGYDKSGTKCILENITANATKSTSYSCPEGYTKTGLSSSSKCTKESNSTIDATKSTKTVTKYNYKWSTETSLSGWEKTGKTREVSSK